MPQRTTIAELSRETGVRFGTSGARGLVTAMTDRVCYVYACAFVQFVEAQGPPDAPRSIALAADRRASSPRIAAAIATALRDCGWTVRWCGAIPTPALANHAFALGWPSIMVTGSHIPDDRNGIKFHRRDGELLKTDEAGLSALEIEIPDRFTPTGDLSDPVELGPPNVDAATEYVGRYVTAFGTTALAGQTVGVYGHSAVGRDLLCEALEELGAETVRLGWSDSFVSVDTEAVAERDIQLAKRWASERAIDAIVSTDGDSDRPLLSDEAGTWCRGDIVGLLCAQILGVRSVVTPVSSSTVAELSRAFDEVARTRIGSPYVIAGMSELSGAGRSSVGGYEANGGFLLESDVRGPNGPLARLPTRDAFVVIIAILSRCNEAKTSVSQLVAGLPQRSTSSDRLQDVDMPLVRAKLETLADAPDVVAGLDTQLGDVATIDTTDGVRVAFSSGDIVHLRPSGNAPELRCYAEAQTPDRAAQQVRQTLAWARTWT